MGILKQSLTPWLGLLEVDLFYGKSDSKPKNGFLDFFQNCARTFAQMNLFLYQNNIKMKFFSWEFWSNHWPLDWVFLKLPYFMIILGTTPKKAPSLKVFLVFDRYNELSELLLVMLDFVGHSSFETQQNNIETLSHVLHNDEPN